MEKYDYIVWGSPVHKPTPDQLTEFTSSGHKVISLEELNPDLCKELKNLKLESNNKALALEVIYTLTKLKEKSNNIRLIQLGGSPAFLLQFGIELNKSQLRTTENFTFDIDFSYSPRISVDKHLPNGDVEKVITFKHQGYKRIEQ